MIIFLLIGVAIASVPALRSLRVLLEQIPQRNDDFDLSLLGRDDVPELPPAGRAPTFDQLLAESAA